MRHPYPQHRARRRAPGRRLFAALLALALVVVACGGGDDDGGTAVQDDPAADDADTDDAVDDDSDVDDGDAAEDADPVTLRVGWYGGEARHSLYDDILALYEEQNPHVSFSREGAEWDAYWERLGTQAAASDEADIMHFTNMQLREWAVNGVLLPLDDYVDDGTIDLSDFDDQLVEGGRVDGPLFALPTGYLILSTVVNTDFLEEAGVTLPGPEDPWTWDDFREQGNIAAENLDGDRWFSGDFGSSTRVLTAFMRGRGQLLFDTESDPPTLGFTEQDLVDWLNYWEDLRQEGVVPPASVSAEQSGLPFEDQMFSADETGIYLHTHNTLTNHVAYTEGNLELRRLPMESLDIEDADYFFSVAVAISANTEHPEEAARFLDFFLNDPEVTRMYAAEFGPPASESMREVVREVLDEEDDKVIDFSELMLDVGLAADQTWPSGGILLNEGLLSRANEQVAFGQATPEEAAESFFNEANSALQR